MFDVLLDKRIQCLSIVTSMNMADYLDLVEAVYKNDGGLDNQRGPLKTKTAVSIRNRMVKDIQEGAVLPPVVLGVLVDDDHFGNLGDQTSSSELLVALGVPNGERLSIIDGMQRTTAMKEASLLAPLIGANPVRVEFWVSRHISSLIYRMLILNTGQVPWELSRQLQTIYTQFLSRIREELGPDIEIFLRDDRRRRVAAGQYQSSNVIELLLIFSSRRTELDIRDKVAEDFARFDAIESTAHSQFLGDFVNTLKLMAHLDRAFSRMERITREETARFNTGKDIFASFPAMVGFCSAVSIALFDEPGFEIKWEEVPERLQTVGDAVEGLISRLNALPEDRLEGFMQLDLLEERLGQRSGQVGRFEREFFRRAFMSMIRNADRIEDMAPCWMA